MLRHNTALGAFVKLRKATIGFVMSVCPHGTTRLPPDGFSLNLIFEYFFSELCRGKFKFHYRTLIKGTLHEDKQTFMIISRSMLLRMRNVSGKSRTENQNTHFMLNNFILGKSCVYKMWENIVEPDRPQMTIWRMRMSRYVPKATNTHTHTQYVTPIAFPLQQ